MSTSYRWVTLEELQNTRFESFYFDDFIEQAIANYAARQRSLSYAFVVQLTHIYAYMITGSRSSFSVI